MGVGGQIVSLVVAQARREGEKAILDRVKLASGDDADGIVAWRTTAQVRRRVATQSGIHALI